MLVSWKQLMEDVERCEACGLCRTRTHVVPGGGDVHSPLMFVGEGPGAEEDRQGLPFVGPAGKLLDKMIEAIGVRRQDVYVANVVKCRPPGNRNPTDEEAAACLPFLRQQVALIQPRVIVCLGSVAARHLISPDLRISRDRGEWVVRKNYFFMPTYHPAALLRNPEWKKDSWKDFKSIRDMLRDMDEPLFRG
nr:uracil-DNA glycosylase [Gehongia tenuis]